MRVRITFETTSISTIEHTRTFSQKVALGKNTRKTHCNTARDNSVDSVRQQ